VRNVTRPSPLRSATQRALSELVGARDARLTTGWAIAAGAAMGALAALLKASILVTVADPGYVALVAAVIAATWLGGIPGGLAALVSAAILHGILILADPLGWSEGASAPELFKEAFFIAVSLVIVWLVGSRRAAHDRVADALQDVAALAQALEDRDQRLEIVLAASGTGTWEWDMVTGELVWSDAIYEQHGIDPASGPPTYEAYLESIHPDDRARFRDAVAEAIEQGGNFDVEFRIVWPDGSIRWTRGSGRAFRDPTGRPVRMIGTGQDITERMRLVERRDRLLEEERRAGEFRDAFIDVISHELRTPITTILGLTQILTRPGRKDDPAARASILSDVRAESERLHRLVEDLLVLSRVEHGRLVVETEPIEPRRLIERIISWEAAEHPGIVISLDVEPYLPIVSGEATYVEQVVRNLLDNAAKYSPPGTPVTVSARTDPDGVAIRVIDSGPGIAEDSADRLFELFYRDPSSARIASGSGIGLFVCASLVQAMGGRIWARRRPEGGSEFGFTLRSVEADDDELTPEAGSGSETMADRDAATSDGPAAVAAGATGGGAVLPTGAAAAGDPPSRGGAGSDGGAAATDGAAGTGDAAATRLQRVPERAAAPPTRDRGHGASQEVSD
jgi:signal transduction histidine kinase